MNRPSVFSVSTPIPYELPFTKTIDFIGVFACGAATKSTESPLEALNILPVWRSCGGFSRVWRFLGCGGDYLETSSPAAVVTGRGVYRTFSIDFLLDNWLIRRLGFLPLSAPRRPRSTCGRYYWLRLW